MLMELTAANLESMRAVAHEQMLGRICAWLRRTLPVETDRFGEDELADSVARLLGRAAGYGIQSENALGAFAALALTRGAEFDADPAVQARLRDRTVAANERILRILDEGRN